MLFCKILCGYLKELSTSLWFEWTPNQSLFLYFFFLCLCANCGLIRNLLNSSYSLTPPVFPSTVAGKHTEDAADGRGGETLTVCCCCCCWHKSTSSIIWRVAVCWVENVPVLVCNWSLSGWDLANSNASWF